MVLIGRFTSMIISFCHWKLIWNWDQTYYSKTEFPVLYWLMELKFEMFFMKGFTESFGYFILFSVTHWFLLILSSPPSWLERSRGLWNCAGDISLSFPRLNPTPASGWISYRGFSPRLLLRYCHSERLLQNINPCALMGSESQADRVACLKFSSQRFGLIHVFVKQWWCIYAFRNLMLEVRVVIGSYPVER